MWGTSQEPRGLALFHVVPSLREEIDRHSSAAGTWLQPVRGALGGQLAGLWTKLRGGWMSCKRANQKSAWEGPLHMERETTRTALDYWSVCLASGICIFHKILGMFQVLITNLRFSWFSLSFSPLHFRLEFLLPSFTYKKIRIRQVEELRVL